MLVARTFFTTDTRAVGGRRCSLANLRPADRRKEVDLRALVLSVCTSYARRICRSSDRGDRHADCRCDFATCVDRSTTSACFGRKCRCSSCKRHPWDPDRRCGFFNRHHGRSERDDRRPTGGDCSSWGDGRSSNRRCSTTTSDTFPRSRTTLISDRHTTSSHSHKMTSGRRSLHRENDAPTSFVHGLLLDEESHDLTPVPFASLGDGTEAKRGDRSDEAAPVRASLGLSRQAARHL